MGRDSLFDMDGTLVDSTQGVVGAWHHFAKTYPGLNVEEILSSTSHPLSIELSAYIGIFSASHGVRTVENLQTHCGITDSDELEASIAFHRQYPLDVS